MIPGNTHKKTTNLFIISSCDNLKSLVMCCCIALEQKCSVEGVYVETGDYPTMLL